MHRGGINATRTAGESWLAQPWLSGHNAINPLAKQGQVLSTATLAAATANHGTAAHATARVGEHCVVKHVASG